MRLERHISIAWFCFGKSCLSYAIFNFWILSPNNLFIRTVTQSKEIVFKFPHAHNTKIHSANSSSLWTFFSPHAHNAKILLALNWQHWKSEIESVAEDSVNFWRTGRVIGKRASKSVMYQWLLCNTKRHVAATGQGYGRFHFNEAPLTCVTFMTCYITFKLPFIPAFFGEHVCFSTPPPPLSLSAVLSW